MPMLQMFRNLINQYTSNNTRPVYLLSDHSGRFATAKPLENLKILTIKWNLNQDPFRNRMLTVRVISCFA